MTTIAVTRFQERHAEASSVPLSRVVRVELRKMFDTRSGFWLLASIVIAAVLATAATIMFAPESDLTYYTFAKAIGLPMTVVLPIIAVLSITGEWSQRTGLTTFTLVPDRRRVILAKAISSVAVGIASMLFAFAIGAVGNVVGTAITGTNQVWNVSPAAAVTIVLGNLIGLLTGTMLGLLVRHSAAALTGYFVYSLLLPSLASVLATSSESFARLQPWVDLNFAQSALFLGSVSAQQWAHLAVTVTAWLVLPMLVGLRLVMRSEVR